MQQRSKRTREAIPRCGSIHSSHRRHAQEPSRPRPLTAEMGRSRFISAALSSWVTTSGDITHHVWCAANSKSTMTRESGELTRRTWHDTFWIRMEIIDGEVTLWLKRSCGRVGAAEAISSSGRHDQQKGDTYPALGQIEDFRW